MYGTKSHAAFCSRQRSNGAPPLAGAKAVPRRIALLASGRRHGPITRLLTPWDIGELTRPFIFLDYSEVAPGAPVSFWYLPTLRHRDPDGRAE